MNLYGLFILDVNIKLECYSERRKNKQDDATRPTKVCLI